MTISIFIHFNINSKAVAGCENVSKHVKFARAARYRPCTASAFGTWRLNLWIFQDTRYEDSRTQPGTGGWRPVDVTDVFHQTWLPLHATNSTWIQFFVTSSGLESIFMPLQATCKQTFSFARQLTSAELPDGSQVLLQASDVFLTALQESAG